MFVETTALHKLLKLRRRIRGVQGGTSASKTISIEQILIDKASADRTPTLTSITSESMPHLKRGAMRDFLNILTQHNYFDPKRWNKSDFIYTFPLRDPVTGRMIKEEGSKIEFFSLDMPHKVRGPRRERLFVNEANNIPKETFEQLEVRTRDEIWADWNPTAEFWFHEDYQTRKDVDSIILTYKDNEGLPPSIVQSIEARKNNKNWWTVYGLGLIGEVEGRIYGGWKIIDDIPHEARLERIGLDFGFSHDPAAIVEVYYYNGGYIFNERLYRTGMTNKPLSDFIANSGHPNGLVIADSAEPKSITEMQLHGTNIIGTEKGWGKKLAGINFIQGQRISVTKRSVNLIREYRGYMWKTDPLTGEPIREAEKGNDHALDAVRYAMQSLMPIDLEDEEEYSHDDADIESLIY